MYDPSVRTKQGPSRMGKASHPGDRRLRLEDELGVNISELHHDQEEASINWELVWAWTHSREDHPHA